MDLSQLVTVYGPLGLGWPLFIYMLKQYKELILQHITLHQTIMQTLVKDTEAKVTLSLTLSQLLEDYKKHASS